MHKHIRTCLEELDLAFSDKEWFKTANLPGGLIGTAFAIRTLLDNAAQRVYELHVPEDVLNYFDVNLEKFPHLIRKNVEKIIKGKYVCFSGLPLGNFS